MKYYADGSFDIYFAPEAPKGYENNFIPTGDEDFYKTWVLGDLEKVNL